MTITETLGSSSSTPTPTPSPISSTTSSPLPTDAGNVGFFDKVSNFFMGKNGVRNSISTGLALVAIGGLGYYATRPSKKEGIDDELQQA